MSTGPTETEDSGQNAPQSTIWDQLEEGGVKEGREKGNENRNKGVLLAKKKKKSGFPKK